MKVITEENLTNEFGKGGSEEKSTPGSRFKSSVQVFPVLSVLAFTNKNTAVSYD